MTEGNRVTFGREYVYAAGFQSIPAGTQATVVRRDEGANPEIFPILTLRVDTVFFSNGKVSVLRDVTVKMYQDGDGYVE